MSLVMEMECLLAAFPRRADSDKLVVFGRGKLLGEDMLLEEEGRLLVQDMLLEEEGSRLLEQGKLLGEDKQL